MLIRKPIQLEIHGAVAVIRLVLSDDDILRNPTPAEQLESVCQSLNEDANLRAVVLTNNGENFWHDEISPWPKDAPVGDLESVLQRRRVATHVANLKAPTIAAIQGRAWNQGLELALACDLRLAAEGSTFGFSCLAEGYIPWDGGSQRLPRIIGRARALELLLTGRSVSASEALEMGLVNVVTPGQTLEATAIDLGQTIAAAAPIAVRYVKEAVYKGLDMSLAQGLNLEADLSFILQTTQDRRRGIQAFLSKTKPQFTGE